MSGGRLCWGVRVEGPNKHTLGSANISAGVPKGPYFLATSKILHFFFASGKVNSKRWKLN